MVGCIRRAIALSLLAAGLAGCGGTITYGSSKPTPQGQPPGIVYVPSQPPLTPPPGTTPGSMLAFDARTGDPLWQGRASMSDMGQPVVAGGLVFVQGGYGGPPLLLAAFNAKNGHLVWSAQSPVTCGVESIGPAILLVVSCEQPAGPPGMQRVLRALDPKTGRELWTAEGVAAAVGSGKVILTVESPTGGDFKLRGLDPPTGQQLWETNPIVTNTPPLVNDKVALLQAFGCPGQCPGPGQARAFITGLDPATGSQLWQISFGQGSELRRLLLGDVAVFSVDLWPPPSLNQPPSEGPPPGATGALDLATGKELWRQSVTTELSFPALAVPGTVYVEQIAPSNAPNQCPNTRLDALDSKSGTPRWLIDNLRACEMTVDSDGHTVVLVLTSFSGTKIVVLDSATGTELWEKSMPTSGLYPLVHASVSDGVVYVSQSGHFTPPTPVPGD